MKRLTELTSDDLDEEPVWAYYTTTDDESAMVDPSRKRQISQSDGTVHVARTRFVLADGTVHIGFCSPQEASGLDYLQPVITTSGAQVRLWFERVPSRAELDAQWKVLGRAPEDIFPIQFECDVPVDGVAVRGVVRLADVAPRTSCCRR